MIFGFSFDTWCCFIISSPLKEILQNTYWTIVTPIMFAQIIWLRKHYVLCTYTFIYEKTRIVLTYSPKWPTSSFIYIYIYIHYECPLRLPVISEVLAFVFLFNYLTFLMTLIKNTNREYKNGLNEKIRYSSFLFYKFVLI